jgi:hypothetical protein
VVAIFGAPYHTTMFFISVVLFCSIACGGEKQFFRENMVDLALYTKTNLSKTNSYISLNLWTQLI